MTAGYQYIALAKVKAGMKLSDELLDAQGHVLLPKGSVLTDEILALMPRHDIAALPIEREQIPEAQLAEAHSLQAQRIAQLFRHHVLENDADWATAALRRYVSTFRACDARLGGEQAP
jgi:hypothetical protein